jgi:ribosome-binding factor A
VRTEIGRAVRMRHTPEIVFRLDSSLERGARINQLLAEISSSSDDETAQGAEDPE